VAWRWFKGARPRQNTPQTVQAMFQQRPGPRPTLEQTAAGALSSRRPQASVHSGPSHEYAAAAAMSTRWPEASVSSGCGMSTRRLPPGGTRPVG
jgi:hypothetical protein